MASIIFLGTAGSSAVMNKQLRASGGIILVVQDLQFHIDPGPGALNKAKEFGVNLNHNTAVLVSHHHLNHCNDLNVVVEAMTHGGLEHRGIVLGSKSVFQPTENSHPFLTRYHQNQLDKVIPMDKNHKVGIELVEINSLSAEHTDPSALGFKFYGPKFTLSYSGDTNYNQKIVEEMSGSDIVILNVPYPGNKGAGLNLDTASAIKIISQVRPKLAILTHFGLEMLKADPLVEAREVQRITGVQTIAAKDGLLVSTEHYNKGNSMVKGY